MPIAPLPSLDRTSATFRTDVDTFFATELPAFSTEAEAARLQIVAAEAATAADAIATADDAVATAADRVQTGLDAAATAADRVQTGLDRASATASASTATTQAGIATTKAAEAAAIAASVDISVASMHAATSKATPVDADEVPLLDSTASFGLKKLTWTNIKATLKAYFDTLYQSTLVSGANIKTIGGASLLGSGDIAMSSGALTLLSTVTASAAATVDIETGFGSTYDDYIIIASGVRTSTALANISARLKIGGSYIATGYDGVQIYDNSSSPARTTNVTANGTAGVVGIGASSTGDGVTNFEIKVFDANSTIAKGCFFEGATNSTASTALFPFNGGFGCRTAGVLSGVRMIPSAGAITGTFRLYGIAKS